MEDSTGAVRHGGAARAGQFLCISQGGSGPFSRSSLTAEGGFALPGLPPEPGSPCVLPAVAPASGSACPAPSGNKRDQIPMELLQMATLP